MDIETTSVPVSVAVNVIAVGRDASTSSPPVTLTAAPQDAVGASVRVPVSGTFTVVSAGSVRATLEAIVLSMVTVGDVMRASGTAEEKCSSEDGLQKGGVFIDFHPGKARKGV
jgi:hypothetical protein